MNAKTAKLLNKFRNAKQLKAEWYGRTASERAQMRRNLKHLWLQVQHKEHVRARTSKQRGR